MSTSIEKRNGDRIRRLARKDGLVAQKSRRSGLWYFCDQNRYLQSPEAGLTEEEALEYLAERDEPFLAELMDYDPSA